MGNILTKIYNTEPLEETEETEETQETQETQTEQNEYTPVNLTHCNCVKNTLTYTRHNREILRELRSIKVNLKYLNKKVGCNSVSEI